jgi:hypothetical protein
VVSLTAGFADLPSDVVVDQSNVDRVLEKAGHPEGHSERLERAHLLLDTRLAPFWAGELPGRTIRFKIHLVQTHRASYLRSGEITTMPAVGPELWETEPVAVGEYVTNGNGLVATELHIPWKDIEAKAPTAVVDALKQRHSVGVVIHAKMLDSEALTRVVVLPLRASNGVRLISDMDDTVKRSEILGGAKMVFRNVFCRPSEDLAVRGMAELFADLADEGAKGLHFVVSPGCFQSDHSPTRRTSFCRRSPSSSQ